MVETRWNCGFQFQIVWIKTALFLDGQKSEVRLENYGSFPPMFGMNIQKIFENNNENS